MKIMQKGINLLCKYIIKYLLRFCQIFLKNAKKFFITKNLKNNLKILNFNAL
ncbi:hypothetical protein CHELV3228_0137 [Campylobacter helveticus]|nr:hypothetical protein CHELV3228_0137 [Campylobacter helveticus]